jgi:hypothetical protein
MYLIILETGRAIFKGIFKTTFSWTKLGKCKVYLSRHQGQLERKSQPVASAYVKPC